jgi:hypothetical protein
MNENLSTPELEMKQEKPEEISEFLVLWNRIVANGLTLDEINLIRSEISLIQQVDCARMKLDVHKDHFEGAMDRYKTGLLRNAKK